MKNDDFLLKNFQRALAGGPTLFGTNADYARLIKHAAVLVAMAERLEPGDACTFVEMVKNQYHRITSEYTFESYDPVVKRIYTVGGRYFSVIKLYSVNGEIVFSDSNYKEAVKNCGKHPEYAENSDDPYICRD